MSIISRQIFMSVSAAPLRTRERDCSLAPTIALFQPVDVIRVTPTN